MTLKIPCPKVLNPRRGWPTCSGWAWPFLFNTAPILAVSCCLVPFNWPHVCAVRSYADQCAVQQHWPSLRPSDVKVTLTAHPLLNTSSEFVEITVINWRLGRIGSFLWLENHRLLGVFQSQVVQFRPRSQKSLSIFIMQIRFNSCV